MSSNISNSSLTRTRSIKLPPTNTFKPPTSISNFAANVQAGPSNITLFLTNLRLLDLDLQDDWPGVTAATFSTKDQNQKKRIQAVEWALYQLFALWDPEETRTKLQPFFPPHEQLQSLNLRNALFRCLDQAKKNGALGRDTVLRKTMLDECKGERLEEVLAVFSNAVLKKSIREVGCGEHAALAQQLALENFSYHGERASLASLVVAHKASLSKHLREKEEAGARYKDFSNLLDLNDRRIARRHEQLKQAIEENGTHEQLSSKEASLLQGQVQKNWSGNPEWLESILFGDSKTNGDGLLASRFGKVWKHVEGGSIGDVESKSRGGLLEQLDARVKSQESRLARWQDFGRTLSNSSPLSPLKKTETSSGEDQKFDLGFNLHQALQIGRKNPEDPVQSTSVSLEEYTRLIDDMSSELSQVGKPQAQAQPTPRRPEIQLPSISSTLTSPQQQMPTQQDEGWSSASDSDQGSPRSTSVVTKTTIQTPPSGPRTVRRGRQNLPDRSGSAPLQKFQPRAESSSISPPPCSKPRAHSPESMGPPPLPLVSKDSKSDLADAILNSITAASPSPRKQRHTLSLAERTRLSVSRASHNQLSDLHDDFEIVDLPRLTIRSRPSLAPQPIPEAESGLHEGLIERTRKSMAGFEAAQKKAQLERRRSMKEEKKRVRQSSYFPKVEEEKDNTTPDISAIELMEGDPDYESVFKSRPKIKTSPGVSPIRSWDRSQE